MTHDNIIEALKEDYSLREILLNKGLTVQDELEAEIKELEEQYISECVVPALDAQADEMLSDLKCEVSILIHKGKGDNVLVMDVSKMAARETEEDEDESDEEDNSNYATREEMKVEAISRMKKMEIYPDIVRAFAAGGEPQVYEPPYGASYALDDEQQSMVRYAEENYHILVWGVIECFMSYNREQVPVYCMLYVFHDKDTWADERKNLYEGTPHVFTYMPAHNLRDSGSIYVYKSEGGTLLRR